MSDGGFRWLSFSVNPFFPPRHTHKYRDENLNIECRIHFLCECSLMVFAWPADSPTRSSTDRPALFKLFMTLLSSRGLGCLGNICGTSHSEIAWSLLLASSLQASSKSNLCKESYYSCQKNMTSIQSSFPSLRATYAFTCAGRRSRAAEFPECRAKATAELGTSDAFTAPSASSSEHFPGTSLAWRQHPALPGPALLVLACVHL